MHDGQREALFCDTNITLCTILMKHQFNSPHPSTCRRIEARTVTAVVHVAFAVGAVVAERAHASVAVRADRHTLAACKVCSLNLYIDVSLKFTSSR
jgi:hypothetical protein